LGKSDPLRESHHGVMLDEAEADAGAVEAVTASATCPGLITADFTLSSDLECTLMIDAPGLTIDLGGHTLIGGVRGRLPGQSAPSPMIRNGAIDGRNSTTAGNLVIADDLRMDNVEVRNSRNQFTIILGGDNLIENSRFLDNGGSVFDLFWNRQTTGTTIRNSYFRGNGRAIAIQKDSNNRIQHNVFVDNFAGLSLWNEDGFGVANNLVANNTFIGNRYGVWLRAREAFEPPALPWRSMENNRLINNVFLGNDNAGMSLQLLSPACGDPDFPSCAGEDTVVERNTFVFNGFESNEPEVDDGLYVTPDPIWTPLFTVRRNTAIANADLGIEAQGVVDGGKNLGLFNGDRRQCVGVRCGPRWPFGGI
jgi:hypothetical protein